MRYKGTDRKLFLADEDSFYGMAGVNGWTSQR